MSSKAFDARKSEVAAARKDPVFTSRIGTSTYSPSNITTVRRTYYTTVYRDTYIPPLYGHSYGGFSEGFMWAMMFNAAFAHNHHDDTSYQQWRREADERAKSDDKIRDQLAKLDAQVASMKDQPRDPKYLPADVPNEVIYDDEVLTGQVAASVESSWGGTLFWILFFGIGGITVFVIWKRHRNLRYA
jgi:hypothetical protein